LAKRIPSYKTIENHILYLIETGRLKPNERIPSESTLMKIFGVSRITVRRALDELTICGYIYRLQGIGAFVSPKPRRETLANKAIGCFLPGYSDYISMGVLEGVEEYLLDTDYYPVFQIITSNEAVNMRKYELFKKQKIKGLMVFPTYENFNFKVLEIFGQDFPIIFVDRRMSGYNIPAIESDNVKGGYDATEHLIKHGANKIAFVTGEDMNFSSVYNRFQGLKKAAKNYGLKDDQIRIFYNYDDDFMDRILEEKIDSIFACNDITAFEIISLLESKNLSIPENMKIIGFDDIELSKFMVPPLTTVKQFHKEIGKRAAAALIAMINGEFDDSYLEPVRTELIIRKSCGC